MKRFSLLTAAAVLAVATTSAIAQETPAPEPKRARPVLTDEQRAQQEQRLDEQWNKLPLEGKTRLMRLHRALREMPPEERKFIHDRIERFLNMSPEEKQKIRENAEKWRKMTPEEREQARQKFRERRREFEEKWKREHPGQEPPPFPFRGGTESAPLPAPPSTTEP